MSNGQAAEYDYSNIPNRVISSAGVKYRLVKRGDEYVLQRNYMLTGFLNGDRHYSTEWRDETTIVEDV